MVALLSITFNAQADPFPITFGPGDYDNTANTVTAGPTTHNNQTTGLFRDVFWWSINNGQPRVGSGDYINQGNSLVLSGNHAVPGQGPYTALNFTGPSISGGQSYLAIYDTTPGDGTSTKNVFDARLGLTVSADVLFAANHNASGGVVALYNEGQDALALVANNAGGNNHDRATLALVYRSQDNGDFVLQTIDLGAGGTQFVLQNWYNVAMVVSLLGDTWTMNGTIRNHAVGTNPNSALGGTVATILYTGSLSNPDGGLDAHVLTNPGEIGLIAMGNESITLPDNVGVSITNFAATAPVPEPGSIVLLGTVMMGVGMAFRRRFSRKA